MAKTVAVVGTLDTKGKEFAFLKAEIERAGLRTLTIDTGILGPPVFAPDIPRSEVARAAGEEIDRLAAAGDRGRAILAMSDGIEGVIRRLFSTGRIDGIVALGGSAGTTIGTRAMRALPVGVPKLMVSTVASGDTRPYVGTRDIMMLYSVVDISGLNRISRVVLTNAARAIAGALEGERQEDPGDRPIVSMTMFGVTTPCVERARSIVEQAGYEVLVFHATGAGGRAMEDLIQDGFIDGVLDLTTTEWADEIVGGILSAGPSRLDAAGKRGIPQVLSVGACDMVNFGPFDTVPAPFGGRTLYRHNPNVTLMRTTPEECAEIGRVIAAKANAARGPTAIILPLGGVSAIDAEGKPFHDPQADAALFDAIRSGAGERVRLIELPYHVNDPEFAEQAARELLGFMAKTKKGKGNGDDRKEGDPGTVQG